MKFSKKFLEDLHKIGEWSFVEKNMWIGKLVPEIIVDNLQKRGINQEDVEGCVVLTLNQAKELALKLKNNAEFFFLQTGEFDYDTDELWQCLTEKIEQAEKRE